MPKKKTTTRGGASTGAKAKPGTTDLEHTLQRFAECADKCRQYADAQETEREGSAAAMRTAAAWIDDASKAVALEAGGDPGAREALTKVFHGLRCWWQGLTGVQHSPGHGSRMESVREAVAHALAHFTPALSAVGERDAIDTSNLIDLPDALLRDRFAGWGGAWTVVRRIEARGGAKAETASGTGGTADYGDQPARWFAKGFAPRLRMAAKRGTIPRVGEGSKTRYNVAKAFERWGDKCLAEQHRDALANKGATDRTKAQRT